MKKALMVMLLVVMSCFLNLRIKARESIFNWVNLEVDVCYGCNINDFILMPKVALKEGYEDSNLYVINDKINNTFLQVIKTNVLKTYKHYYKVVSPKYSQHESVVVTFSIIDDIAPVVTVNKEIQIDYGVTKIDFIDYLNITDNETKNGDFKIVVNESGINYQIIGNYDVHVTVYDKSLNQTSVVLNVAIVDRIKPIIVLNKPLIVEKDILPNYHDYFIFKDNYHTTLDVVFHTKEIDISTPGVYNLIINVTDIAGNTNNVTHLVEVRDTTNPILNLKYHTITLAVNKDQFILTDAVYSILDGVKPLKDEQLVMQGDYNINEIGSYVITYTLTDLYGNQTVKTVNIIVDDKEAPVIEAGVLELKKFTTNIDFIANVVVSDNYDNSAHQNLSVFNHNIDVNKAGVYYINYECFDARGNYAYYTRTVLVIEPVKHQTSNIIIYGGGIFILLGLSFGVFGLVKYQKKKVLS